MKGCRPLTDPEIAALLAAMDGKLALRDRALVVTGLHTGFRISELLSLRVRDVYQRGQIVAQLEVPRRAMKGKRQGRSVVLHPRAATALAAWIAQLHDAGFRSPHGPVFRSWYHAGVHGYPVGRAQAWRIVAHAARRAGLTGRIGTHSWRKTFATRAHAALDGDLRLTQAALGHEQITSTAQYLGEQPAKVDAAILGLDFRHKRS